MIKPISKKLLTYIAVSSVFFSCEKGEEIDLQATNNNEKNVVSNHNTLLQQLNDDERDIILTSIATNPKSDSLNCGDSISANTVTVTISFNSTFDWNAIEKFHGMSISPSSGKAGDNNSLTMSFKDNSYNSSTERYLLEIFNIDSSINQGDSWFIIQKAGISSVD